MFKGKVVPCFIRWSESGGMSSIILKEIFETIDHFQLLPRTPGVLPFAMLDGHGSRLELPFLKYINNKTTEWCVCLGVPYGTAYWQVGDSKEQNGSFNMAMTDAKRKLLNLKRKHCLKETIDKTDLMLLINIAWNKSFARIDKNRKAIADRGWGPYNRNILTLSHIRATMTNDERKDDAFFNYEVVLSSSLSVSTITNDSSICNNNISSKSRYNGSSDINLNIGIAASVTDTIVQHEDRLIARERINNNQISGKTFKNIITDAKKMSAGLCFKNGEVRLGKTLLDGLLNRKRLAEDLVIEKVEKKGKKLMKRN